MITTGTLLRALRLEHSGSVGCLSTVGSRRVELSIVIIGSVVEPVFTRRCITGGGPAGMMLGFLLACQGVDTFVLEKHADFLRDFRGDTIRPSTLEIMYELGILDEFLKRPHQEIRELAGQVGKETVTIADFTHLPTHCRFLAFMPQWDFLISSRNRPDAIPHFT